jgi:hypothetical protein
VPATRRWPTRNRLPHICDSRSPQAQLGSGGGTAHVLAEAWTQTRTANQSFREWTNERQRIVLHGGGESRRLPAYAGVGKLFIPMPVLRSRDMPFLIDIGVWLLSERAVSCLMAKSGATCQLIGWRPNRLGAQPSSCGLCWRLDRYAALLHRRGRPCREHCARPERSTSHSSFRQSVRKEVHHHSLDRSGDQEKIATYDELGSDRALGCGFSVAKEVESHHDGKAELIARSINLF